MVGIGNFFGSFLRYLLRIFYQLFENCGVAIILFIIVLKIMMSLFFINQQRSVAANSKLFARQEELQKEYDNNHVKMNDKVQKLYEKEEYNSASGCLPMLIPLPIMIGLCCTVTDPLSNVLHLGKEAITQAVSILQTVPGISGSFTYQNGFYNEMEIVRHFSVPRPYLTMFADDELSKIQLLSSGFNFLELNLLGTPTDTPVTNLFRKLISIFQTNLWLIPILCLVSSIITQVITTRLQPAMQQQQGCVRWVLYGLSAISVVFVISVPATVGFYWIISTLASLIQVLLVHAFFSPAPLTAKAEAQRIALLELEEAALGPLPLHLRQYPGERFIPQENRKDRQSTVKKESGQKKKSGKSTGGRGSYLRKKKQRSSDSISGGAEVVREAIATGDSVEQAFEEACKLLEVESHEAGFEILELSEKKRLDPFGGAPTRVRALIKSGPAEATADYLKQVLGQMGIPSVETTIAEQENGTLLALIDDDIGFIIGHRGETLGSLQYLSGLVANHVEDSYYRITFDIGNYCEKQKGTLEVLGKKITAKALKTQRNCSLEPVNPYERRIIHTAVQEVEGVRSWGEGEDLARHVVTGPEDGEHPAFRRPNDHSSRGSRNFHKDRGGRPQGDNENFNGRSPSRDLRDRRPARCGQRDSYSQPVDSRPVKRGNSPLYNKIETRKEN